MTLTEIKYMCSVCGKRAMFHKSLRAEINKLFNEWHLWNIFKDGLDGGYSCHMFRGETPETKEGLYACSPEHALILEISSDDK